MTVAHATLCGLCLVSTASAFSPAAVSPNLRLRTGTHAAGVSSLRAAADDVSRRSALTTGIAAAAVTLAAPREAFAQRTLTKALPDKLPKPAPVEDEDDDDAAKPKQKGKTFATGRKTDANAGQTIGAVLVGSVALSLPFYWANVKRFFGKYTDIAKATAGLTDGDESRAGKQQEDM